MAKANTASTKKPKEGELTQSQGVGEVAAIANLSPGFTAAPEGNYATYRAMRGHPTIALARMVATAPIRTAKWSIEADDEVDDEKCEFVQSVIENIWPDLIKQLMFSLDYGWAAFEKVWAVKDGQLVYDKLKPLLVDKTEPIIDEDTGQFLGVKQDKVVLPPEKCFVFSYDNEAGSIEGRSRHENVRDSWHRWNQTADRLGRYIIKTSGIIPLLEYPDGESLDQTGAKKPNHELAKSVLSNIGQGHGVAMPNVLARYADDLARAGADISKLKAWHLEFMESKGLHGQEYIDAKRYYDSLMMRGWLVPERAATEGQSGTKAESETQGELVLVMADMIFDELLRAINRYLVNPLLIYNYGEDAAGTIRVKNGGISPLLQALYIDVVKAVLANPSNVDLFLAWCDVDALLDTVGIPKAQEVVKAKDDEAAGNNEGKKDEEKPTEKEEQADIEKALSRLYVSMGKAVHEPASK